MLIRIRPQSSAYQYKSVIVSHIISQTMLKLVYGKKNKIIKLQPPTYDHLRRLIGSTFADAPADYCLTYLDADKDEICLTSDEDLQIMMSGGLKVTKVFVKQSLTQTLVIEPEFTEQISVSFEEKPSEGEKVELKAEDNKDVLNMLKKSEKVQDAEPVLIGRKQESESQEKPAVVEAPAEAKEAISQDVVDGSIDKAQVVADASSNRSDDEKKLEKPELFIQQIKKSEEDIIAELTEEYRNIEKKKEQEDKEKQKLEEEKKVSEIKVKIQEPAEKNQIAVKPLVVQKQYKDVAIDAEIPSPQKEVIIPLCLPVEPKPEEKPKAPDALPMEKSEWAEVIDFGFDDPAPEPPRKVEKKEEAPAVVPRPPCPEKKLVQHETMCCICKDDYGIIGDRYQCIFCESFNLCSNCEAVTDHPHALLKVKDPKKAVSREQLNKIFGSQGPRVPEGVAPIPPTHYVPSINKDEAMGFIKEAQKSLDDGYQRGRRMLEDMFLKLELNHRNPYEHAKPIKTESQEEKATRLSDLFGINYREALIFAKKFPNKTAEQVTQIYIDHQNNKKKEEVKYPMNPYEARPRYGY